MDNKNVGAVIIMRPNHNNYGTSLQGFATVRVLQNMGVPFRIIRYNKKRSLGEILKTLPGYLKSGALKQWLKGRSRRKEMQAHPECVAKVKIRTQACNAFKNKYLEPLCDYYTGWKALTEGSKNYSSIFVGSDQVWGPLSLYAGFYNLMFVDKSVPQFSYSSSFGKSFIMDHQKKGVAKFLNKMDAIGVREIRGAEIVKELTGRDATVVADPTLLLTQKEWTDCIKDSSAHIGEPYMLSYMLGPRTDNREAVKALAKELGVKLVTFPHIDWYEPADEGFGDIQDYNSDCLDFVKLISEAEYVVTDSFHCSVFSIIFHRKFLTLYRVKATDKQSAHSRIESLLSLMGLPERATQELDSEKMKTILAQEPDWDKVDGAIDSLRSKSLDFFKNALSIRK